MASGSEYKFFNIYDIEMQLFYIGVDIEKYITKYQILKRKIIMWERTELYLIPGYKI